MKLLLIAPLLGLATFLVPTCVHAPFGGEKESALITATAAHDVAAVRKALAAGADPNRMVPYGGLNRSPWQFVLKEFRPKHPEDVEIIKAMLKSGADPMSAWGESVSQGITRRYSSEPLLIVMLHPNADVVRALLEAGLHSHWGEAALVMAIEQHQTEIAHLLVESGVDVNGFHAGAANTPLVAAIEARDFKMMTFLESHGAREKP